MNSEIFEAVVEKWLEDSGMDDMGLDPNELRTALRDERIAIVELDDDIENHYLSVQNGIIVHGYTVKRWLPRDARAFVAALLAAADDAEADR